MLYFCFEKNIIKKIIYLKNYINKYIYVKMLGFQGLIFSFEEIKYFYYYDVIIEIKIKFNDFVYYLFLHNLKYEIKNNLKIMKRDRQGTN